MSFGGDDTEHEITTEGLLLQILRELKIFNIYMSEMTGLEIEKGDIDE